MSHYGHIRDETQRRMLAGASREFAAQLRSAPTQRPKAAWWSLYEREQAGEILRPTIARMMREALQWELAAIESHARQLEELARQQGGAS